MDKFKAWCGSNEPTARLTRTIFQAVLGVLIANADMLVGSMSFDPATKTLIVALVMAILSPIQAALGNAEPEPEE